MKNTALVRFLCLVFAWTWGCWWLAAVLTILTSLQQGDWPITFLFYIGGFGPVLAYFFTNGCHHFPKKFIPTRQALKWFLTFLLAEFLFIALSSRQINPHFPLTWLPLIWLRALICDGGQEEIGWRGFLQSQMQSRFSFHFAAILSALIWMTYHIPLWFIRGNSHQGSSYLAFCLLALFFYYWNSALYVKSQSILASMIFHATTNTLFSLFVLKLNLPFLIGLIFFTAWTAYLGQKSRQ